MLYLKRFSNNAEYQQYIEGAGNLVTPNISYIMDGELTKFKPYFPIVFTGVVSATSTSTVYSLFSGSTIGINNIKSMKIDGVEVTPVSATTFTTTGEHTLYVEAIKPISNMSRMFQNCGSLTSLDLSNWDTSNVTDMSNMFYYCYSLTSLDLSTWDLSNLSNSASTNYMFEGSYKITDIKTTNMVLPRHGTNDSYGLSTIRSKFKQEDIQTWDTSNVTDMSYMFNNCSGLTSLDLSNWDTSNVTNMSGIFYKCSGLTSLDSISNWNTSKVTSMYYMFSTCSKLTSLDLSKWDTSNVTDMSYMFYDSYSLTSVGDLSNWDTNKVTNMRYMFSNCTGLTSLDLSNWDTSEVTDMKYMFFGCSGLTYLYGLNTWDVSNVTDMRLMFQNCGSLTSLDLSNWDTSNVTNMGTVFGSCYSLTSLDLSGWDTSNVTDMSYMFWRCKKLAEIIMGGDVSKVTNVTGMFDVVASNGTFYYNSSYDYSKILAQLPSTWTAVPCTLVDGELVPNN